VQECGSIHPRGSGSSDHSFDVASNFCNMVKLGGIFDVEAVVDSYCKLLIWFGGGFDSWVLQEDDLVGLHREVFGRGKGAFFTLLLLLLVFRLMDLPHR
jgi:hypothetical protein